MLTSLRVIVLAITLFSGPLAFGQPCSQSLLSTLRSWVSPATRAFDRAAYDKAKAAARRYEVRFSHLDTPEKLFGFLDAQNGGKTLLSQVKAIEELNGRVQFREFRIPRVPLSWKVRAPQGDVCRGIRHCGPLPYPSRGARFIITVANAPPETNQELADLVVRYSSLLTAYRMYLVGSYAPLFPKPWRPSPFPETVLKHLSEAEDQTYSTLTALERMYPGVVSKLPATDHTWQWKTIQTVLGLPLRLIFPFYDALAKYRPNEKHREAYVDRRLDALLAEKYGNRLRVKWFIDRFRTALVSTALVGTTLGAYDLYQTFSSAEVMERLSEIKASILEMPERYSPERINRALDRYESNVTGDPVVVDFYEKRIAELRDSIQKKGDPDGSLSEKIRGLEERRDALKN